MTFPDVCVGIKTWLYTGMDFEIFIGFSEWPILQGPASNEN